MTVAVILLAVYSAVMTYLRMTASRTKTLVDDKLLEAGEKIEPLVDLAKDKILPPGK